MNDPCGERYLDRATAPPRLVDCAECGVPHWWCDGCQRAACAHVVDTVAAAAGALALAALRRAMDRSEALLRGEVAFPAVACRCEMQEHGE